MLNNRENYIDREKAQRLRRFADRLHSNVIIDQQTNDGIFGRVVDVPLIGICEKYDVNDLGDFVFRLYQCRFVEHTKGQNHWIYYKDPLIFLRAFEDEKIKLSIRGATSPTRATALKYGNGIADIVAMGTIGNEVLRYAVELRLALDHEQSPQMVKLAKLPGKKHLLFRD